MADTIYKSGTVDATGVIASLGCEDATLPVGCVVGGTFVGTVLCEISYDPDATAPTWVPFGSALTAPGTVKVDIPCKAVRLRCSDFTSGEVFCGIGVQI